MRRQIRFDKRENVLYLYKMILTDKIAGMLIDDVHLVQFTPRVKTHAKPKRSRKSNLNHKISIALNAQG